MVSIQNFSEMFSLPKRCKLHSFQDFPTGTRSQSGGAMKIASTRKNSLCHQEMSLIFIKGHNSEFLWSIIITGSRNDLSFGWKIFGCERVKYYQEILSSKKCQFVWGFGLKCQTYHCRSKWRHWRALQVMSKISRHPMSIIWICNWLDDWLEYYSLGSKG